MKLKRTNKITALLMVLTMLIQLVPAIGIGSLADTTVVPQDENGVFIGFVNQKLDGIEFTSSLTNETKSVSPSDVPKYLILKQDPSDSTLYRADTFNDDFYFSVLSKYDTVRASSFVQIVDAKGLYASFNTQFGSIKLYEDYSAITTMQSYDASLLTGEYVISEIVYDDTFNYCWYVKFESLPDAVGNHLWALATQIDFISLLPSAPSLSQTVNGLTVNVYGDIPEGATLSVTIPQIPSEIQTFALTRSSQSVNTTAANYIFDIKIYDKDGNEWQPIDEGKTVKVSLPVDDPDIEYVDVYHFIDYAPAMHDNVEYVSVEGIDEALLDLLADAIEISNTENHVAAEVYERICIIDQTAVIQTNSFSIYSWTDGAFEQIGNDANQTKEEFNNSWGNDGNNKVTCEYYATKDHNFILTTTTIVSKSDCAFSIQESVNVTAGDITGTFTTTVKGAALTDTDGGFWDYHDATVVIPETAAPGETIVVRFKGASYTFYMLIHIVDEYTIDYQSPNVEATGLPEDHTDVTDGIKESYTIPSTTPTPNDTHYTFAGWNTSPDGSGTTYQPGDKMVPMRSMTLYAIWQKENSIVKFDPNGGVGTYEDMTIKTGNAITLPEAPVRVNYEFLGWSATTDGYSTLYAEGASYTVHQDVTLYAVWGVKLTITVTGGTLQIQKYGSFNPVDILSCVDDNGNVIFTNKGTSGGVTTYEATIVEGYLQNAIIYFNYQTTYKCSTASTGASVSFANFSGQTRANLTGNGVDQNTTINFIATEKTTYIISFDSKGGSVVSSITKYEKENLTASEFPADPTKLGYTFAGWYDASNNKVTSISNITANITLYAKWTPISYTLTYDYSNGSTTKVSYTIESSITIPSASKGGYTFTGWLVTTADGSWILGRTFSAGTTISGMYGNVTLTAQYSKNSYTITWQNGYGGTLRVDTVEFGATVTPHVNPTRTGYTFAGWDVTVPATMPAENLTITATWTINQYTITWSDGLGSILKTDTLNFGDPVTAPANPSKEGYIFVAWGSVPATMPAEHLTITATWQVKVNASIDNHGTIDLDFGSLHDATATGSYALAVPYGLGGGAIITFTPAENYKIVSVTVNGVALDSSAFTDDAYVYTVPAEGVTEPLTAVVTTALKLTSLTIGKKGYVEAGENQTFLYKLTNASDASYELIVTVHGNEEIQIDGLSVQETYTVIEMPEWSWRYEDIAASDEASETTVTVTEEVTSGVEFTLQPTDNKITFLTSAPTKIYWLSGDSWCKKVFN